jgi:hypothetical protein
MNSYSVIYIALMDEGVDVWRPVNAENTGNGIFRILEQPYDREIELWQFEPGDLVYCELVESSDGPILTAITKVG